MTINISTLTIKNNLSRLLLEGNSSELVVVENNIGYEISLKLKEYNIDEIITIDSILETTHVILCNSSYFYYISVQRTKVIENNIAGEWSEYCDFSNSVNDVVNNNEDINLYPTNECTESTTGNTSRRKYVDVDYVFTRNI